MKPWTMCENVYQSVRCCEFSELLTMPCHSLTVPQAQIGTRPMPSRMSAAIPMTATASQYALTAP